MAPDIGELVAALPDDLDDGSSAGQSSLEQLLAQLSHKPVPVGRLARLWTLGSMEAKIAVAYLAYWIRTSYATKDEKERQLNETHLKAALQLLGGMSYLRGAIMKIGQTLAQYPQVVPAEYAEVLGQLHFEAPPMHYSLLREHLRNELGADPEKVFAEFEHKAFAAASLGQVHRARLKSGEAVAVKVQYPNIARTIESDFRNFMALMTPMRLSKDWDNIRAQWEDIRQMLTWETDYLREADFLRRARAVFADDEGIVVPRVFDECSTKRVLTMEFIEGMHLKEYLAGNPSQSERDRYGELLLWGSIRVAHAAKLWYADANPGNFLFMGDGRLGLIDFGCCREFSAGEWEYYSESVRSFLSGDPEAHRRLMCRAVALDPDKPQNQEYMRLLLELHTWFCRYLTHEGKFDFGDEEILRQGVDLLAEATRKRYFRSLPVNTWINRQLLGIRAVLFRLQARVDAKIIFEQESVGLFD